MFNKEIKVVKQHCSHGMSGSEKPGGTDYAHLITIGTPGFSDLPTALRNTYRVRQTTQVNLVLFLYLGRSGRFGQY